MSNEEKKERQEILLAEARQKCLVSRDMIIEANKLQIPVRLVWFAAGAGLAHYHKNEDMVISDIRAELGEDSRLFPRAFFDGYQLETLRGQYAL